MSALRSIYVIHVVWYHPSRIFYILPCILWLVTVTVTVTSNVTDVWQHDLITLILFLSSKNRKLENKLKENKSRNENENKLSPPLSTLTLFIRSS